MTKELLIMIVLMVLLLLVSAFAFFCAFRYMNRKEDMPERVFFICLGIVAAIISVFPVLLYFETLIE